MRGWTVCATSLECGNGCVDLRAQELVEHAVFADRCGLLRMVCTHAGAGTRAKVATLSGGDVFLCAGIAFEAHGGDASVGAADSGLLAIRTIAGALLGGRRTSSF